MTNSRLLSLGLCIGGFLNCVGCDRLPGKPTSADIVINPQQVRDFDTLYHQNCSGCHGEHGRGNGALALNNPIYLAIASDEVLRHATSLGVSGTMMPAFLKSAGGTLTAEQIEILANQMRVRWSKPMEPGGMTPPPYASSTPGDAKSGAGGYAFFCASCHGTDGKGNSKGSSIVDGSYLALVSDQGLRTLIIAGRPDLHHPDWRGYVPGHAMTAQEVADVVAWLAAKRVAYPGQPYAKQE
jgi:cytochrome c oxidase cbb3-type subunit 3